MKKRQSALSLGPGASSLILIFVVLSMTVLGMLSLLSARNDLNLSRRSVQVTEANYALNRQAEEHRAELDAIVSACRASAASQDEYLAAIADLLPDNTELDGDELSFSVTDGTRTLRCKFLIHDLNDTERMSWLLHSLTAETGDDTIWN